MASRIALFRFQQWMLFCKRIGWDESDMQTLDDLWWRHHDEETGELK